MIAAQQKHRQDVLAVQEEDVKSRSQDKTNSDMKIIERLDRQRQEDTERQEHHQKEERRTPEGRDGKAIRSVKNRTGQSG